jgi:hypothetical protein
MSKNSKFVVEGGEEESLESDTWEYKHGSHGTGTRKRLRWLLQGENVNADRSSR